MKKKILIIIAVVLLIGTFVGLNIYKSKSAGAFASGKAIEIKTVNPKISDISSFVSLNGNVEEVNKEEVYLDMTVKVNDVLVEKDQKVTKGQKLFELDLDSLKLQLDQANIQLKIQKLQLTKIEDAYKLKNVSQLEATLKNAESNFTKASQNYNRYLKLFEQGAVSSMEFDNVKMQYDGAKMQLDIAQNNLKDLTDANNDLTINSERDIKNQKEQIALTELTIRDLENKIAKLQKQVYAPISGVITELNVQKGSMANPAVRAVKIIDPSVYRVKLKLKEVDILKVQKGQVVKITGDAFPDKVLDGVVDSVGSTALKEQSLNSSEGAYVEVLVTVDNTDNVLKPGLSVTAKVITVSKKDAIAVPFDTIQEDKDGNKWIFVVNNNIVKMKKVEVGINSELDLEVVSGLNGDEVLVQDPPSRLKDGMKVIAKSNDTK